MHSVYPSNAAKAQSTGAGDCRRGYLEAATDVSAQRNKTNCIPGGIPAAQTVPSRDTWQHEEAERQQRQHRGPRSQQLGKGQQWKELKVAVIQLKKDEKTPLKNLKDA